MAETDTKDADPFATPASADTPIVEHDDQMLYGSSTLPATFEINGETVALGTIVTSAFTASGLNEDEWNALPDADRDARLQAELDKRGYVAPAHDAEASGALIDPNAPSDKPAADTIDSRSADADAPGQFEEVTPAAIPVDTDTSTRPVLNAAPGYDPTIAPGVESQRTGVSSDSYRAPAMTRGSAINLLEVRWGELVTMLHDFDHDLDGLPADLVALVDFVKSRQSS